MLKVMEKIQYSQGRNVVIDTPLSVTHVTKTLEQLDPFNENLGYILDQTITLSTRTRVSNKATSEEREFHNRRSAQMFTEELYSEVAQDLFAIIRFAHENVYSPELMHMLDAALRKVRP